MSRPWESKPKGWTGRDLPSNWASIREQVFKRDGYRCRWILPSGKRCPRGRATGWALECDHKGDRNDHRLEALQTLCEKHHRDKTSKEGIAAREAKRKKRPRRVERRPGEL